MSEGLISRFFLDMKRVLYSNRHIVSDTIFIIISLICSVVVLFDQMVPVPMGLLMKEGTGTVPTYLN